MFLLVRHLHMQREPYLGRKRPGVVGGIVSNLDDGATKRCHPQLGK